MIEIVDSSTNLTLMEIKETKAQAALKTGSKIKLFDSDIYIVKRLIISPSDPSKLRILVEKEVKEGPS